MRQRTLYRLLLRRLELTTITLQLVERKIDIDMKKDA